MAMQGIWTMLFFPHGIYLYCSVLFEPMEGAQDCTDQVWDTCTDPNGRHMDPAGHHTKPGEHHLIPCSTKVRKALRCRAQCEPTHRADLPPLPLGHSPGEQLCRQLLPTPAGSQSHTISHLPAKTNRILFNGPHGLILQYSLSTKYYYYPNCLS